MTVGMVAEVEGRKTPRCEFGFPMARRHQKHEAINISPQYPLELCRNQPMVAGNPIAGKCIFGERDEITFRTVTAL